MTRLRCTFQRDYEHPDGFLFVRSGSVMDLGEARARRLNSEGIVLITPDADDPLEFEPGGTIRKDLAGQWVVAMPTGEQIGLPYVLGTPHEPKINGVPEQSVEIDAGSDIDHAEIIVTLQATTGSLDAADEALASSRLANCTTNADVINTGISGGSPGTVIPCRASIITQMHIGLCGETAYTTAAGNIVTLAEMVLLQWDSALAIVAVRISAGESHDDGGSNQRKRQLTVVGYSAPGA